MSFWRIAELVADRKEAAVLADRVGGLSQAGMLNEYEEKFLVSVGEHLGSAPLTPRQASILYTIWIERRCRDGSDGVSLKSAIDALSAIALDLDDDEKTVLKELSDISKGAQLADINRASRIASNHELDFDPISRGWRIDSDADARAVQALAVDLARTSTRRTAKPRGLPEVSKGHKATGNDLSTLLMALSSLEAAIKGKP